MSKSDPSDQSRINLLGPKCVIKNKIKRRKTDSLPGLEFDNSDRPECNHLLSVYQPVAGKTDEVRYSYAVFLFFGISVLAYKQVSFPGKKLTPWETKAHLRSLPDNYCEAIYACC